MQTGCGVLITINSDGTVSAEIDSAQPPYDGDDDSLVGVQNNSSTTVYSLTLTGAPYIFMFDGDGICDLKLLPGCPFGDTGYEGPGVTFSDISDAASSGTVNFRSGVGPGGTAYFSLEGPYFKVDPICGGPGCAVCAKSNCGSSFLLPFNGPDKLNLSFAPQVTVSEESAMTADVLVSGAPLPGQAVVFNVLSGSVRFTNGDQSPDGGQTTIATDDSGQARATFVAGQAGDVTIQVSLPDSKLQLVAALKASAPSTVER